MTEDLFLCIHDRRESELREGTKDVEIRRCMPAYLRQGAGFALYVTKPIGAVRSVAEVDNVFWGPAADLWGTFGQKRLGMSWPVLFEYLARGTVESTFKVLS